ncbi:LSD1 [Auxenochlorella protothecoides x Auxenochlorella symbiontica]
MQSGYRPPGAPQLVCSWCRTLLTYPQGAQHVRCACCHHITEVPRQPQPAAGPSSAPQAAQDMAQLTCTNPRCRVTLTYPRGASQVHCAMCGTLNDAAQANLLGHIVCGGCQITLSYAYGACSVKCAVCNHVTPVPGAPEPSAPRTQAVIVENPSSVDEAGFEVRQGRNMSVYPLLSWRRGAIGTRCGLGRGLRRSPASGRPPCQPTTRASHATPRRSQTWHWESRANDRSAPDARLPLNDVECTQTAAAWCGDR